MKKKILIAEDEKTLAKALGLKLMKAGFNVDIAFDGSEAIELLKKKPFDLLILDLLMPKVDGFGVLTFINRDSKLKIPTIILSNLNQADDEARAKKLGAADFFIKSDISLAALIEQVKKCLF